MVFNKFVEVAVGSIYLSIDRWDDVGRRKVSFPVFLLLSKVNCPGGIRGIDDGEYALRTVGSHSFKGNQDTIAYVLFYYITTKTHVTRDITQAILLKYILN